LRPHRSYASTWNRAVFGPSLPAAPDWFKSASRTGDEISIEILPFSDHPDRIGASTVSRARTTLFRDGVKIGETADAGFGRFAVSPEPAAYRLEVEAARAEVSELSTSVSSSWTFRSGHVDGTRLLPVSVLRFTPRLDGADSAPSGQRFVVPVTVQQQEGAAVIRTLSVEASYDDGRSWRRVPVHGSGTGQGWQAVLQHPAGAGFVSLRASAVDLDGNQVEQTIVRAYRLRA
jgi:hypothetical protein